HTQLTHALAHAHTTGTPINWTHHYPTNPTPQTTPLPTYPFQHQRYWPAVRRGHGDDPAELGLACAGHPLLGAAVEVADADTHLLTGRLSVQAHPWLAGHEVLDTILLPGSVFAELAVHTAARMGCDHVAELIVHDPMALPLDGAVDLQIAVAPPDQTGQRAISIYSRPAADAGEPTWTRHATGGLALAPSAPQPTTVDGAWPPPGATPIAAQHGDEGVAAAWRLGEHIYAEVVLPEQERGNASEYRIHPLLLDAALRACSLGVGPADGDGEAMLPFAWSGLRLYSTGAPSLRVRVTPTAADRLALTAADPTGAAVLTLDGLTLRPLQAGRLDQARLVSRSSLFQVAWNPLLPGPAPAPDLRVAVIAPDPDPTGTALVTALPGSERYGDIAALRAAVSNGAPAPDAVLAVVTAAAGAGPQAEPSGPMRSMGEAVLAMLQDWLADSETTAAQLVVVTRHAVATHLLDVIADLPASVVWGLVRSAQSENPGRLVLLDIDRQEASLRAVPAAVSSGEPQLALRDGQAYVPRLVHDDAAKRLTPPPPSRQDVDPAGEDGADLTILELADHARPLAPGEVRIAVRAVGLSLADLRELDATGAPGRTQDGAGLVVAVGSQVDGFAPGDRVMGLFTGVEPEVVTDQRLHAHMPGGWSYAEAAGALSAFRTAHHALVDRAALRAGETLRIDPATGPVGLAAAQLARHWRAGVVEGPGGDATTADVVLSASDTGVVQVARVDSTDRGPASTQDMSVEPPGAGEADRVAQVLTGLGAMFGAGALRPLPVPTCELPGARAAYQSLRQAGGAGTVVLTLPVALDPEGTVLVTGASALARLTAGHLVTRHGARRLLFASRRGADAPGAAELAAELTGLGAEVVVAACDAGDPAALAGLLSTIPDRHPLTAVIHTAAVVRDATIQTATVDQLDAVLHAKADTAWHLHELTRSQDLSAFVLFSSIAGLMGGAGQGSYAAANTFLDALAQHRHALGLPATSLAWGFWDLTTGMSGRLTDADRARNARAGQLGLSVEQSLALFDAALAGGQPVLVPARLDLARMRRHAGAGSTPALLRHLVRGGAPQAGAATGANLAQALAAMSEVDRQGKLLELVRAHAAAALGHDAAAAVPAAHRFRDLGFDSLTAVELRNRLAAATGLRLPATLVFDHPTPTAVARLLADRLGGPGAAATTGPLADIDKLEEAIAAMPDLPQRTRVAERLRALLHRIEDRKYGVAQEEPAAQRLESATDEELFDMLDNELTGLGRHAAADGDNSPERAR
ncbi:MAG TPA: SDR family NAD(P)-dependent oxidoreductase, partial [Micromonosporaceae bacterium]|nr:SDR family NAD(P)-dependent oxidoreductase [Micromonosporaceae bacterium]